MLDPGRGRTKTGQLWAYARDDRPWAGPDPPGVGYVYAPDRTGARPIEHLAGFNGVLEVDGYGGYSKLARSNAVALAFCWSHVRRKFYELAASGSAPIATEALQKIAALYAVETDIRGRPADERRAERQARSSPLILDLEPWLRTRLETISRKSKLAEAIRYALSRWDGLTRFLDDGRIEIDSNIVEHAIRPLALGRKNHLSAGSDAGAEHWAVLAERSGSPRLHRRRHHPQRPRPPHEPPRRAVALGLPTRHRPGGLRTALTIDLYTTCLKRGVLVHMEVAGAFTNRSVAHYKLGEIDKRVPGFHPGYPVLPELADCVWNGLLSRRSTTTVQARRPISTTP